MIITVLFGTRPVEGRAAIALIGRVRVNLR